MEGMKESVKKFLSDGSGSGYGYGSGSGSGSGYGDGYGYGSGSGYGYGYGYGYGSGSGSGSGYGYGSGSGSGYGDGDGYGSGSGYGDGYGDGDGDGSYIASVNHHVAALVDGVLTVFRSVHKNIARGWILNYDMTLVPCFVVKSGALFAHGETLRDAMSSLRDKLFEDMPEEDRIKAFVEEHKPGVPIPNRELFDWHHRLTGSCLMGRNEFVARHGIDLDGETTPEAFIRLTEHAYGGDVIRKLRSFYDMD